MPKSPQVSIRGETYQKLKEEAERRRCSVAELLEIILETSLPQKGDKKIDHRGVCF